VRGKKVNREEELIEKINNNMKGMTVRQLVSLNRISENIY